MMPNDSSSRVTRRRLLQLTASLPLGAVVGALESAEGRGVPAQRDDGELTALGAREAVARIRSGDMTAEGYAAALLRQYDACKHLNAVITIRPDRVLEAARQVDRQRAKGLIPGIVAGLPLAVKDQIEVAGYPATGGNGELLRYVPDTTAPVVQRLIDGGAIIFAKTMLPDMVAGYPADHAAASWNPYFGPPRNPYDPSRLTGGTSGGNAALLAARVVPAAIGEDMTGSIRFPAALCGVAGLRPSTYTIENALRGVSRKRYSDIGVVATPPQPQETFGPMARTIADVAFLDQIVTGEPTKAVDIGRARVAIPNAAYWDQDFVDPGVAAVMREALDRLRRAGATLVEIDFDAVRAIYDAKLAAALPFLDKRLPEWLAAHLPNVSEDMIFARRTGTIDRSGGVSGAKTGPPASAAERRETLLSAQARIKAVFRDLRIDAIASPTSPITAPPLRRDGEKAGQTIVMNGKTVSQVWTLARNIFWGPPLGLPGLSIPAGLASGLPVGLQLEGLPGSDTALLGLGIAIERILGPLEPPSFKHFEV